MVLQRSAAALAAALLALPVAAPVAQARPVASPYAPARPYAKTQRPSTSPSRPQAHRWRFVRAFSSIGACQSAGRRIVARHKARAYSCDNAYTPSGVPVLDLYVRR